MDTSSYEMPYRACSTSGQPALWPLDTYTGREQFRIALRQLSSELQLEVELATIMAGAQRTFMELGLERLSSQHDRALDSVLHMLDSQLDTVASNTASGRVKHSEACL
jgi:hypothetical protein